jgi:hypothetical protein
MVSCRQDIFGFITQRQTEQREIRDLSGYLCHAKAVPQQVSLILIPQSVGTVHLPADLSAKSAFVGQVVRQPKPRSTMGASLLRRGLSLVVAEVGIREQSTSTTSLWRGWPPSESTILHFARS